MTINIPTDSVIPPMKNSISDSFWKRLASAIVMLPLVIIPSYSGGWWFNILVIICAYLMLREWHTITNGYPSRGLFRLAIFAVFCSAIFMSVGEPIFAVGILSLGAFMAHIIGVALQRPLPWPGLGVVYVGLPVLSLVWLRNIEPTGLYWITWVFVVVWATDIMAYICGRLIGGPRLVPKYSPKKTWSGLVGGMIGAAVASMVVGTIAAPEMSKMGLVFLGTFCALIAQAGDIAESMLKRRCGVKDSGRLIPGHGGILDRVDGLAPAAVLIALVMALAQWLGRA